MATTPGPAPATSWSITAAGSVGSSGRGPPSWARNSSTVAAGKTGRSSSVSRKSAAWSAVRRSKPRVSSTARLYRRATGSQGELHEHDDRDHNSRQQHQRNETCTPPVSSRPRRPRRREAARRTTARCLSEPVPGCFGRGWRPSPLSSQSAPSSAAESWSRPSSIGQLVDVLVLDVLQVRLAEVADADALRHAGFRATRASSPRSRIWPPCPAEQIRAARTTSSPM